jgi:hypothetical protein
LISSIEFRWEATEQSGHGQILLGLTVAQRWIEEADPTLAQRGDIPTPEVGGRTLQWNSKV